MDGLDGALPARLGESASAGSSPRGDAAEPQSALPAVGRRSGLAPVGLAALRGLAAPLIARKARQRRPAEPGQACRRTIEEVPGPHP